ncbi:hypothetical protein DET49_104118 [Salegentibacter sp. 24]|uniref:SLOG domain-containing protein n=1 Tax=Salegentibacter sp. 24 TaxID=2183986 RepID=UPI001061305D|nr:hypothetical protein [Salegentibacter sp. 24]TDN93392.1 hypothetical protein DET49_104118 [Salegentibacter sp. 24]
MAKKDLNKIFLSASIPIKTKNQDFYKTADIIAIRDAVRALATVVIPHAHLIWGGHPSITPLIQFILEVLKVNPQNHITLYQSNFFENSFPKENESIENIVYTDKLVDEKASVELLRRRMLEENKFQAGIFIGGMDGVIEEYNLFRKLHSDALLIPVASSGAASLEIFNSISPKPDQRLLSDFAYMAMFRKLLKSIINQ